MSETHRLSRDYYTIEGSGMKDVHSWLKSLRLHKYSELFSRMTYEQMMSLTEEQLESQGVTKGARHKIILNINKLKNRISNLKALIQSLDEEGCNFIRQALNELKTIINTPIKPYCTSFNRDANSTSSTITSSSSDSPDLSPSNSSPQPARRRRRLGSSVDCYAPRCDCEDNIENQFSPMYQCDCHGSNTNEDEFLSHYITKVIEKIGSLFIYAQYADDECLKMFNVCTDKCLSHEAFSGAQKQRLCFWKQQIDSLRYSLPGRRSMGARQLKGKWGNPKQPNEPNVNKYHNLNGSNHVNGINHNMGLSNMNNSNPQYHHHPHHHQSNYFNNGNPTSTIAAGGSLYCSTLALNAGNSNTNQVNAYPNNHLRRTRPMGQTNLTQPNSRFYPNYNNHALGFPGMERSMNSSSFHNNMNQGFQESPKTLSGNNISSDGLLINNFSGSPIIRSPQINSSGQLVSSVLSGKESDSINTYIEKLCLRMTEQALGSAMDEDMDF